MKTFFPLLAVMLMTGCGNNSMNSTSPSTNDVTVNRPTAEMTNVPAITNSDTTNFPAMTNH
jgi:uncharacterized lipoprotein YajG